jgi:hypothetical protein
MIPFTSLGGTFTVAENLGSWQSVAVSATMIIPNCLVPFIACSEEDQRRLLEVERQLRATEDGLRNIIELRTFQNPTEELTELKESSGEHDYWSQY